MRHLKAVIFDWAGTLVDFGSLAPMGAFVETFAEFHVAITIDEARGPMGMAKRPHIATLMQYPRIAEAWKVAHGRLPTEADIDAVYEVFVPKKVEVAADYAELIPGVNATVAALRASGLKIGSSTGYTREIMARILPKATEQGFVPDNLVCTGDTPDGRPSPLMFYKGLIEMNVWPAWNAVKVDDTIVGVQEGLNAGAWSVGVAVSGNAFGLSLADTKALSPEDFATKRARARALLIEAGAHYVIDSVADLMPVVTEIEGRVARGERP